MRSVGESLSPFLRPWACRWKNHWSLWRKVSATPDLRLPPQPQGITTRTKLYCLVTEARVCKQLAQGCYLKAPGQKSSPQPLSHKSNALITVPPGHTCMLLTKLTKLQFLLAMPASSNLPTSPLYPYCLLNSKVVAVVVNLLPSAAGSLY